MSPKQMLNLPYRARNSGKQIQSRASKLNLNEEMKNISKQTDLMLNEVRQSKIAMNRMSKQS
jgi:hypothetical protein